MSARDDVDPEEWLAAQFGEQSPKLPTAQTPVQPATPAEPAEPAAPAAAGAPFQWGLTPGGEPPVVPPHERVVPAPVPPTLPPQVVAPTPPPATQLPDPFATVAMPTQPTPPVVDLSATDPLAPDPFATVAMAVVAQELVTTDPWRSAPVDSALDGVTEVFEAEIVGLETPVDEGLGTSAIDSLFGDTQFRDYEGEPMISSAVVRVSGPKPPKGPRDPLPRSQKVLMWIAGSLVAVLALTALFLVGTKLPATVAPAPVVTPTPTPTQTPDLGVLPVGPIEPGEYQWDELLGGECLSPFESAWQDRYVVVDCTSPHPAQMLYRGLFDQTVPQPFPGLEELQKATNDLCSAATVINYAIAGQTKDVLVSASFATDATDWDNGNFTYFCFATRSSGEPFTASIAVQQVAVTPTPTPKPKP